MKWIRMFALLIFLLTSCSPLQAQPTIAPVPIVQTVTFSPADAPTPTQAGLPNPASAYCVGQGFKSEIRTAADGSQSGVCIFPDGNECDEWAYFRGECVPSLASPTPKTQDMGNGWKRFTDYGMRFSFEYPAESTIDVNGYTVSVNGPVVENNVWPVLLVSHPDDREEYRVPAGIDLRQWMIDHHLYVDQPQPDRVIAGTTAVHVRFPGGQQSVANDRYYLVHNNQIFVITILHTGNIEDWALYDHFLDSFQFEPTFPAEQPPIPTFPAIQPSDYQGWWTYTHAEYAFSIMLPEDWVVEEITTSDPIMNGHSLYLHPEEIAPDVRIEKPNIRMTFRRTGQDALLWPTGIGNEQWFEQGTLIVDGQPAQRIALVCPNGNVSSIKYHDGDGQPNITRGDMEFGFIYNAGGLCESGLSLNGKIQHVGEMIIASLRVP